MRGPLLVALLCACTPPQVPSPAAKCVGKPWYPGVTDPKAPQVTVVLEYQDTTPAEWTPEDICLLVDDQAMLKSDHRNFVIPRLPKRETLTWRATLPPGTHKFEVFAQTELSTKRAHLETSKEIDVQKDTTIDVTLYDRAYGKDVKLEIEDRPAVTWTSASGVPALPKPPPPKEEELKPTIPELAIPPDLPKRSTWGVSDAGP